MMRKQGIAILKDEMDAHQERDKPQETPTHPPKQAQE